MPVFVAFELQKKACSSIKCVFFGQRGIAEHPKNRFCGRVYCFFGYQLSANLTSSVRLASLVKTDTVVCFTNTWRYRSLGKLEPTRGLLFLSVRGWIFSRLVHIYALVFYTLISLPEPWTILSARKGVPVMYGVYTLNPSCCQTRSANNDDQA